MPARPDPCDVIAKTAPKRLIALGICLLAVSLACGACGRRGSLEAPNGATRERSSSAPASSARGLPQSVSAAGGAAAPDSQAVLDGDELPVSATPAGVDGAPVQTSRGAKKGFTIPKGPFILDPIL